MPLPRSCNAAKDIILSLLIKATQGIINLRARDASPWLDLAPILIVAPHPDDETLGCGGFILRARQRGRPIRVVIVSDGAQGSKGNDMAASQLAAVRQREALCATALLGLAPQEVIFLAFPDGNLSGCAEDLDKSLKAQITAFSPRLILSPYLKENHPDHRAIAESIARLRRDNAGTCQWVEYPVWFWPTGAWRFLLSPNSGQLYKLPLPGIAARKKAAMASYQSQLPALVAGREPTAACYFRPRTLAASFLGQAEYYITPPAKP